MGEINYYLVRSATDFNIFKNMALRNKISQPSIAVLWEAEWASFFIEKKIKHILLDEYARHINYRELRKKITNLISIFPHNKILDGESLAELLEYDGFSLWWFIRQGFYTHCFNALKEIEAMRLLLENKEIAKVVVLSPEEDFIAAIKEATKRSNAEITYAGAKLPAKIAFFENKMDLLGNLPRISRIIQGFFRNSTIRDNLGKFNILLLTRSHVWSTLSNNTKGDANSFTIMNELSKSPQYSIIQLDVALTKDSMSKGVAGKKKSFVPYDYFIFMSYFDSEVKENIRSQRPRLRSLWRSLDKNNAFKKALMCNGISLYPILRKQLKSYFFNDFDSFIGAIRNIEIGKKIMDDYKISALIAVDENGSSRFLVFAAKSGRIPSIGLQHGVISPNRESIAYSYSRNDLYGYKNRLNCQLADKTAVWGSYFKKLLVEKGNYINDNVIITGQPRLDIAYRNKANQRESKGLQGSGKPTGFLGLLTQTLPKANYSKKSFYRKFGIESSKKLVVFASEPMKGEFKATFSAVVKALKQLENAALVVKLHPKEEPSIYKQMLKEMQYKAIVSKDIDLYETIACSDAVIAIHSTAILEALSLERPVIQLNLMERYDVFGKTAKKAIIFADSEKRLLHAKRMVLHDKPYLREFSKKTKKFIPEYFYKIDGKSTERFIKVLRTMLEKRI